MTTWTTPLPKVAFLAVALSSVVAQLLDGVRTAYLAVNIPIPVVSESTCIIYADYQLRRDLCGTHLIMWNEIEMIHLPNLEAVDRTLRDLRRSTFPFGGIIILCIEDFR